MNLFIFTGLLIILYSFVNYKKAFILFLIFRLFLNQNINLINIPGIPLLTLEFTILFFFLLIYFFKKNSLNLDNTAFPFKKAYIFLSISYVLSCFFGLAGFGNSITNFLKIVVEDFASTWLIWKLVKEKKDFTFFIKGITVVFVIAGLYGIYESLTHSNPLANYEISIAGDSERVLDWTYDNDFRGYRIKSIFLHSIGGGMNFVLYFLLIIYSFVYYKKIIPINYFICIFIAILSLIGAYLCNSRGPILFLLIGFLPILNFKKKRTLQITLFSFIALFIVILLNPNINLDSLISIFSSTAQEKVGGSTLEMRLSQISAGFAIMKEHILFGIGLKGSTYFHNQSLIDLLLGMESMWLRIMVEQGILGVIANLFFIYTVIVKLAYKEKNALVFFLSLSFFIVSSMTSTPGFAQYFLYLTIFMFIKYKYTNINAQN